MRENRNRLIEDILGRQELKEFEDLGRPDVEPNGPASKEHLASAVQLAGLEAMLAKAEGMSALASTLLHEKADRDAAAILVELMRQVAEQVNEVLQAGARSGGKG